jgi:hypothetical protein
LLEVIAINGPRPALAQKHVNYYNRCFDIDD